MEPSLHAHETARPAEAAQGALPAVEPASFAEPWRERDIADRLEAEGLVFLPETAFRLTPDEQRFLTPAICDGRSKNVSYDPVTGRVSGTSLRGAEAAGLAALMSRYAFWAEALVADLAPRYLGALQRGRTSLRPRSVDEAPLSSRRDDRRLHADAFPSQPTGGRRLLRVFSNISPDGLARVWQIGEPFETYARRWLPHAHPLWPGEAWLLQQLKITKARRTPYDAMMLALHDAAKLDEGYQRAGPRREIVFPARSSWIVFTDSVVHAAITGRHALEQTFYLPVDAMVDPSRSPLRTLESLTGQRLC